MWPWEESGTRLSNSSGGRGRGPGERREGVGCPWQTRESLSSRGGSRWVRAWWFCGWGAQWDRTGQDKTGQDVDETWLSRAACGVCVRRESVEQQSEGRGVEWTSTVERTSNTTLSYTMAVKAKVKREPSCIVYIPFANPHTCQRGRPAGHCHPPPPPAPPPPRTGVWARTPSDHCPSASLVRPICLTTLDSSASDTVGRQPSLPAPADHPPGSPGCNETFTVTRLRPAAAVSPLGCLYIVQSDQIAMPTRT